MATSPVVSGVTPLSLPAPVTTSGPLTPVTGSLSGPLPLSGPGPVPSPVSSVSVSASSSSSTVSPLVRPVVPGVLHTQLPPVVLPTVQSVDGILGIVLAIKADESEAPALLGPVILGDVGVTNPAVLLEEVL